MYPLYGQDPVSVPFKVDITNCRNAVSYYLSSSPAAVVQTRSVTAGSTIPLMLSPTYKNLLYTSDSGNCPTVRFGITDASGSILNYPAVTLVDPESVSTAKLMIKDDQPFTTTIRIYGYTKSLNAFMTLSIRVCGQETISLAAAGTKSFVFGFAKGNPASLTDT